MLDFCLLRNDCESAQGKSVMPQSGLAPVGLKKKTFGKVVSCFCFLRFPKYAFGSSIFRSKAKVKVHCFFWNYFGPHESLDRWQFAICVRMYVINQTEWKLTLLKSKQVEILIATTAKIWHFISGLFPDPTSIERDNYQSANSQIWV